MEALSAKAIGMAELSGGMHGQAYGAERGSVGKTIKGYFGELSERNSHDATVTSSGIGDVPGIVGGIASQVGGEVIEGENGLAREGTEIRDISGVEGLSVFSQHDSARVGYNGGSDPSSRAPEEFLLFFDGAIGLFLVGAALDAQAAIGIAFGLAGFVIAVFDIGPFIVLLHPGVDVFHIEGHCFAQTRDFVLESMHSGLEERLEQAAIEGAQFLTEPVLARQGLLDIEAVGLSGIKNEVKAEFDHQQGMAHQEAAQLRRVKHTFADADEEGFQVSTFGMSRASASRAVRFPLVDDGPIEQSEEGAIVQVEWIVIKQSSDGRLVKKGWMQVS
ncbi:MAG TPA: hypothetical protein VGF67_09330 [Ktedonobacteraceae bacterium]